MDIDGTLVGADGRVPESAAEAIRRARENGHKIFICSGRCRCEMHENILCVPLDGIVGSAGAYVEIDGRVIFHRSMTEKMNAKLLDYFLSRGMAILLETNGELYGNDVAIRYMQENADYCEVNGLPYDKPLYDLVQPLADVQEPAKLAVNKLIYITKKYDPEEVRRDLGEEFTVVDSAIDMPGNSGEVSENTGVLMREAPRLKEQNFGKYESTPRHGEEFEIAKTHFIDHYEGGESMLQMAQRIYNLLDEVMAGDKTYLLVAHNGISRFVESYFHDMTNEEFAAFGIRNCEIRKYER